MSLLKGGVDSGNCSSFAALQKLTHKYKVEDAAKRLDDSSFLCAAAWGATQDSWIEYNSAAYHCGRYDVSTGGYYHWNAICHHFRLELDDTGSVLSHYRHQVTQDTIALINTMGQWYDSLVAKKDVSKAWAEEYADFVRCHKSFVRRFYEYRSIIGKDVPAI